MKAASKKMNKRTIILIAIGVLLFVSTFIAIFLSGNMHIYARAHESTMPLDHKIYSVATI